LARLATICLRVLMRLQSTAWNFEGWVGSVDSRGFRGGNRLSLLIYWPRIKADERG
jgi:hypothetical protein